MLISSTDNPLVKRLACLSEARDRREQGLFLVEGQRVIDGFLSAGWLPQELLIREGEAVPPAWPPHWTMSDKVATKLSQQRSPSGYIAAFALPVPPPLDVAAGGLVLADVADPGNVGTVLRSAAAFGVRQVIVAGGADPFAPKVIQASAGALALLALHRHVEPPVLAGGAPCCALVVSGGVAPAQLTPGPRWLVVGGEAHGVPESWLAVCREQLTLPMPGGTESLNAAVAGSIAVYALSVASRA